MAGGIAFSHTSYPFLLLSGNDPADMGGDFDMGGSGFGGEDPFDDDDFTSGDGPLSDLRNRAEEELKERSKKYLKDKYDNFRNGPKETELNTEGRSEASGSGESAGETGAEAGTEAGAEVGTEVGAEAGTEATTLAVDGVEGVAALEGAEAAIETAEAIEAAEAAGMAAEAAGGAAAAGAGAGAAGGAAATGAGVTLGTVLAPCCCIGCITVIVICTIIMAFSVLFGSDKESGGGGDSGGTGTCSAETVNQIDGLTLPYENGKLGHEEHLTNVNPSHYAGADSSPLTFAGAGSFAPHTTEQERWYITSQWVGANWEPTRFHRAPVVTNPTLYAKNIHKKLILTSVETGKSVVASIEEAGPALWVTDRDGVQYGAPPEVYKALGGSDPYTGNPNDNAGRIKVAFAKDQTTPLGVCASSITGPGSGTDIGSKVAGIAYMEYLKNIAETPLGSNSGTAVCMYLNGGGCGCPNPWCAGFVSWAYQQAGISLHECSAIGAINFFSTPPHQKFSISATIPQPGDVLYRGRSGGTGHVGIVFKVEGTMLITIEGNSSDRLSMNKYSNYGRDSWLYIGRY